MGKKGGDYQLEGQSEKELGLHVIYEYLSPFVNHKVKIAILRSDVIINNSLSI